MVRQAGRQMTAEEAAYQKIVHLILAGHYKPGDFLLEVELSNSLGMSRTPVSRAISRLVVEGFLCKMPKKGCYIPQPTPQDSEQVFRARMVAEGKAAALAAEHATDEEIAALARVLEPEETLLAQRDKDQVAQINRAFHLGIARASHNAYIENWCRTIFWKSNLYIFYFDSFYHLTQHDDVPPQQTPVQHKAILEAIRQRNPELAEARMLEHIQNTFEKLLYGL
ncbi:MAG: GntR family transcriptional regulator [Spirochaetaceae bacterium]|nr:GntR family transcriptional regulator [Spirochaetaceae bacterium]